METQHNKQHKNKVHHVLAHSYVVYFIFLLVSVYLDSIFKIRIFTNSMALPIGVFFLVLASILIIWAQKTGHNFTKVEEKKAEHFFHGPYRYSRIPTHFGLLLLILGFGIINNSFFVVVSTVVSFIIAKIVFIKKHDKILAEKYGEAYAEYKKLVKF